MAFEEDFNEGWITTNNVKLHCVVRGEGQLMLMLHGFPEFWYSWRHQISEFAENYQVVAPDLRGYNDSEKPRDLSAYGIKELIADVKGIIEGLEYESCILVGHDWGGYIAWNFAFAYPEMVDKLIVLNAPHPAKFKEGMNQAQQIVKSWYIFFFQISLLPELLLQWNDYQLIESIFVDTAVDKTVFNSADIEAYKDAAAKRGALTAMLNYYRNIMSELLAAGDRQWDMLPVDTLMIWGENDTALGKELTYGTDEYVENLSIKYIANCSHWVQQEQPELVNQYIREFLAKKEAS